MGNFQWWWWWFTSTWSWNFAFYFVLNIRKININDRHINFVLFFVVLSPNAVHAGLNIDRCSRVLVPGVVGAEWFIEKELSYLIPEAFSFCLKIMSNAFFFFLFVFVFKWPRIRIDAYGSSRSHRWSFFGFSSSSSSSSFFLWFGDSTSL